MSIIEIGLPVYKLKFYQDMFGDTLIDLANLAYLLSDDTEE